MTDIFVVTAVHPLILPNSISFSITLPPGNWSWQNFLLKYKYKSPFQSLVPLRTWLATTHTLLKSIPFQNPLSVNGTAIHRTPHPTTWGPSNLPLLLSPMSHQYPHPNNAPSLNFSSRPTFLHSLPPARRLCLHSGHHHPSCLVYGNFLTYLLCPALNLIQLFLTQQSGTFF